MRNKKLVMVLAISAVVMAGCKKQATTTDNQKEQAEQPLVINQKEITFTKLGESELLGTEGEKITWTSSDDTVAVVEGNVVIAKGNGTALITGTNGTEEVTCTVKVASEFAISIEGEEVIQLNSKENNKVTLSAKVKLPTVFDEVDSYTFSSSDETVATVDAKTGEVTAVGQGFATITATTDTEKTTKIAMMGQEMVSTEPAADTITVVVDNEMDSTIQKELVGNYTATYDWQGFDEELSETYAYTNDNFKWIRSILSLELSEDGSFHQKVLNAQRAGYPSDASCPNVTDLEKKKEVKAFYVYNRFDQSASELNEGKKEFHDIEGMAASGVNNFVESGVYAVFKENLVLSYHGMTKELGPVKDMKWLDDQYVPFVNMVQISENMSMNLKKVTQ